MLLVGCSEQSDQIIRFGLASAPRQFDPRFATDATSERLNRLFYQQLIDFDDQGRVVPSLATWEKLSPVHYRFSLSPARFHDGELLLAKDVVATYLSILEPSLASPHRESLKNVLSINVVSDVQLDFVLKMEDNLFPSALTRGILSSKLIAQKHAFHSKPIGSGQFSYVDGAFDQVKIKRLSDNQQFEFVTVKDPSVRILKLLRGELDILQNDLPSELINFLTQQPKVKLLRRQGSNFSYMGFNLADKVTGQQVVRQAIAQAIDRAAIVHYLLNDGADLAQGLFSSDHWLGYQGSQDIHFQPEKSKQLLGELGYDIEHPLEITYKTSSDPFRIRIATVIQQQLAEVGIKLTIRSYDWGTFFADIKAGNFQMYSLTWVGLNSPDVFRNIFHTESMPPKGVNRGRLNDAMVDEWIEQAEKEQNMSQKAKDYQPLYERLLVLLAYIPLWYEDQVALMHRDVNGYELASDGNYDALINVTRTRGQDATVSGY